MNKGFFEKFFVSKFPLQAESKDSGPASLDCRIANSLRNKKPFRNKKGSDKIISVYWFAILILIAGGVVAMVYNFSANPYDVRNVESDILLKKISDCVSREGVLDEGLLDESFRDNFLDNCGITFETENEFDWSEEVQYLFELKFYNLSSGVLSENVLWTVSGGNLNWKGDCFIDDKKGKNYEVLVRCQNEGLYVVDSFENEYLVEILTGVGKHEKNIKQ